LSIALILVLCGSAASAQTSSFDLNSIEEGFRGFADTVAPALPFNATLGLVWSDAYIGNFPHFGIGATVGATTIPAEALKPVFTVLGAELPGYVKAVESWGIPMPAFAAEGRIGGFFLPFDVGLKYGFVPPDILAEQGVGLDYQFFGGELRYALIKQNLVLPNVSVGLGVSRLNAGIRLDSPIGDLTITQFDVPNTSGGTDTYSVNIENPQIAFDWGTTIVDAKAQVSKSFFVVTPYAGLGATYGASDAGGGFSADVTVRDSGGTAVDLAALQEQIQQAEAAGLVDVDLPDITEQGVYVSNQVDPALAFRAFAGVSLNLLVVKFGIGAMYDIASGSLGGGVNLRVQL
jgi:hypothetical protein